MVAKIAEFVDWARESVGPALADLDQQLPDLAVMRNSAQHLNDHPVDHPKKRRPRTPGTAARIGRRSLGCARGTRTSSAGLAARSALTTRKRRLSRSTLLCALPVMQPPAWVVELGRGSWQLAGTGVAARASAPPGMSARRAPHGYALARLGQLSCRRRDAALGRVSHHGLVGVVPRARPSWRAVIGWRRSGEARLLLDASDPSGSWNRCEAASWARQNAGTWLAGEGDGGVWAGR